MAGRQANLAWETLLDLSATRSGPLHMRLAAAIRAAIRDGRLPVGAALPPTRTLAADLSVSRWTVTEAYGHLVTEGYLTGKTGSATRVTWSPRPGDEPRADPARGLPAQAARPSSAAGFDMSSYHPDPRTFPRRQWVEAIRAAAETAPFDRLYYSEPGGLPELRAVLAEHLNRSRGASAEPATICVVMGAGQGMSGSAVRCWPTGIPRLAWRILGPHDCGRPRRRRGWNWYRSPWTMTAWSPAPWSGIPVCAPYAWARPGR
jgi:GntR family transcriptional regulator / MocR family aminotransferase